MGTRNVEIKRRANSAIDRLYTNQPSTVERVVLKQILLLTGGQILTCGYLRNIKQKHLGVGVYNISLEEKSECQK